MPARETSSETSKDIAGNPVRVLNQEDRYRRGMGGRFSRGKILLPRSAYRISSTHFSYQCFERCYRES